MAERRASLQRVIFRGGTVELKIGPILSHNAVHIFRGQRPINILTRSSVTIVPKSFRTSDGLAWASWYMELADTGPDHNNLHISETYCLKCQHIHGAGPLHKKPGLVYDLGISNHVFSDRAESTRAHAKDGWLRVERTRVAAHRREWRTGKRDAETENEICSLEKLERRFKSQMHAGAMPRKSCRRPSLAKRGEKVLKSKSKARQKSMRVAAAFKAMRAKAKALVK